MEWKKIGLAICIILIVILALFSATLQDRINTLSDENNTLQGQVDTLQSQISSLNASLQEAIAERDALRLQYEELKRHSFTYYVVDDAINISNIGIFQESWVSWTINGTVTNISNKAIQTLYVYLIPRNPDGTADFDPFEYEEIENLYIGETATFEFSIYDYDESQTVEILLIY